MDAIPCMTWIMPQGAFKKPPLRKYLDLNTFVNIALEFVVRFHPCFPSMARLKP